MWYFKLAVLLPCLVGADGKHKQEQTIHHIVQINDDIRY